MFGLNAEAGRFSVPSVLPLKYRSFGYGRMPPGGTKRARKPLPEAGGAPLPLVGSVGPMPPFPLDVPSEKQALSTTVAAAASRTRVVLMMMIPLEMRGVCEGAYDRACSIAAKPTLSLGSLASFRPRRRNYRECKIKNAELRAPAEHALVLRTSYELSAGSVVDD